MDEPEIYHVTSIEKKTNTNNMSIILLKEN
jgi:hypothetical protein